MLSEAPPKGANERRCQPIIFCLIGIIYCRVEFYGLLKLSTQSYPEVYKKYSIKMVYCFRHKSYKCAKYKVE